MRGGQPVPRPGGPDEGGPACGGEGGAATRRGTRFRRLHDDFSRRRYGASFGRLYGESPLHLLVLLASFAVCGYAAFRWLSYDWVSIAVWFVGAAVVHDLVLVPLYAGMDRIAHRLLGGARPGSRATRRTAVNHVRVPAFVSLLLLIVYWPLILRNSPHYSVSTHLSDTVFLGRWLLVTAALFAASAIWFVTARWRTHRAARTAERER